MKVYIDVIFLINFMIDFLILLTEGKLLKCKVNIVRCLIGSIFGSISLVVLFIDMSNIILFIIKFLVSLILILISFGFHNIKYVINNLFYFYVISITLGGTLFMMKINLGNINSLKLNFLFLLIFSPFVLYTYIKQNKYIKINNSYKRHVNIFINNRVYELTGFIDSGNTLQEPYGGKYVIFVNRDVFKDVNGCKRLYVPYKALNYNGVVECVIPDKVFVEGNGFYNNVVIGLNEDKLKIKDVDCLLNAIMMED